MLNKVLFLFDNDAEGYEAHQKLIEMMLPSNIHAFILPELDLFRDFPTLGPEGMSKADINRRAAAIECYLDLELDKNPPKVIWTNYKKTMGIYQGSLNKKEFYTKKFLQQNAKTIANGSYDTHKIKTLLDSLF